MNQLLSLEMVEDFLKYQPNFPRISPKKFGDLLWRVRVSSIQPEVEASNLSLQVVKSPKLFVELLSKFLLKLGIGHDGALLKTGHNLGDLPRRTVGVARTLIKLFDG